MCLQTIQRVLGQGFSQEDCQRALAVMAAHDLLTWALVLPRPSRRQRAQRGGEGLEIVYPLNLLGATRPGKEGIGSLGPLWLRREWQHHMT
jgi:hypothetical protein